MIRNNVDALNLRTRYSKIVCSIVESLAEIERVVRLKMLD
jgi:hypothetical protein